MGRCSWRKKHRSGINRTQENFLRDYGPPVYAIVTKMVTFTAILPCVSFAQNSEIVNRGTIRCMNAGLIHLALGFVGCCWLYAFPSRSRLREHFALPEEPCNDYWVHMCCTPCAICQESRELKNQGADPSLGWVSNIEKWRREKVTPPIVVPGMNR